jgi:radical SAM enzyme (TIGR01210 family)
MNNIPQINNRWITSLRGRKNEVDPSKPYAWLVERELTASGNVEDVAVIFLTNRECPYHCLMCDLWKNTTDTTLPEGFIPAQIEHALANLPKVKHVKLYNSGSFFDPNAVPPGDHDRIASLLSGFETITVESHPSFIDERCVNFRNLLRSELEVAIGLETINPEILRILNKKMVAEKFRKSVRYLANNGIRSRAFILLKPPFLTEEEGIFWAKRSIDFAFGSGAECCTLIPVRPGNGAMEYLQMKGFYTPPLITSLETALEYGISLKAGRVFADTWDISFFSRCDNCLNTRLLRIIKMNLEQTLQPEIVCDCI